MAQQEQFCVCQSVLAPTKAAVLPLVKKDGLPEVAQKIIEDLKWDFQCGL
jgi:glycyl-tRNA synthetase